MALLVDGDLGDYTYIRELARQDMVGDSDRLNSKLVSEKWQEVPGVREEITSID